MPDRRVALSLLAHPDDAEILCGGTLSRLADLGWLVHIVSATPGDCGTTALTTTEIAEIRRAEGQAAAALIGGKYHCLEDRDLTVLYGHASIRKAIDLFRELTPTLVITHPRHDYMLDHEQVHLIARAATFGFSVPNASSLPLTDKAKVPWLYYCDPIEAVDPYKGVTAAASTRIDISDAMDQKVAMLACHASQRQWLQSHHGIDEYIESMKRHSALRGAEMGATYAEAFTQHLGHAYPSSNVLAELFEGR